MITVKFGERDFLTVYADSEPDACRAARTLAMDDSVEGITVHQQLKSGLKLILEMG
jgi:hypothetical protein